MVVNVYQQLGIPFTATPEQIQRALRRAAQNQTLEPNKLRRCRDWLLNPEVRAKYDARLLSENPDLAQNQSQSIQAQTQNPNKIINIYAKLGLDVSASQAQIQHALRQAKKKQRIAPENLRKCEAILLSPTKRAQYNEKLMAVYPELFQAKTQEVPKFYGIPLLLNRQNWKIHTGVAGSVLALEMLVSMLVAVPAFSLTIYLILMMVHHLIE